jgi:ABC-2 type transport system permease protein
MMLLYKAWRESETRFFLSAMTIAAFCVALVVFNEEANASIYAKIATYNEYVWKITYQGYLRQIFDGLVLLLGVGGLQRERSYGTAGFTLALPISRRTLVCTRAVIGFLEVTALSLLPGVLIPAISPLAHRSYPWLQAMQFSLLWAVGGAAIFTMGFLVSIVISGEYAAPVTAFAILLAYSVVADIPILDRLHMDIHDLMSGSGMDFFRASTCSIAGPMPWTLLATILALAGCLVFIAGQVTQQQDF